MEDSYYYKIRGIEGELEYFAKEFKDGKFSKLIPSESKRKLIRTMLANIARYTQTIQQHAGTEFTPEF
jgi:hypothetical protein